MFPGYSLGLFKSHESTSTAYCRDFTTISADRREIAHWLLRERDRPTILELVTNTDRFIYLKVKEVL